MNDFQKQLQQDFSTIRDAIFKYFVYQTSFIKNIEYDANNILKALEEEKKGVSKKDKRPVSDQSQLITKTKSKKSQNPKKH